MPCRKDLKLYVAILFLLTGVLTALAGEIYTFPFSKEMPAGKQPQLDLSNTSGSITINSHSENAIKIEAYKKVKAKTQEEARKMAEHIDIEITSQGDRVEVKTDFEDFRGEDFWDFLFGRRFNHSAWVEYNVWVPKNCQLSLSSTSGDIIVSNIQAPVEISCTSGDIRLTDIAGNIDISVTSGDLALTNLKGNTSISATSGDLILKGLEGSLSHNCSSGDIRAENIKGEVKIETTSGDVRLNKVSGAVQTGGSSSDIHVELLEGNLKAHTTSGNITASCLKLSGQNFDLESSSGDIRLTLPDKEGGRLELETVSGTIRAQMPLTVESISERRLTGYINPGGPEIFIRTTSGDVLLSKF